MNAWGKELILDLYDCDISLFTQESIEKWLVKLCEKIDMERVFEPFFWDCKNDPSEQEYPDHLIGVTVTQFIRTSDIRGHFMQKPRAGYVNIFSCKDFDEKLAQEFTQEFFSAQKVTARTLIRE